jgi:hypothetical protein
MRDRGAWILPNTWWRTAYDAVDGSSTGIAMCEIAPAIQIPPMSADGTKQK